MSEPNEETGDAGDSFEPMSAAMNGIQNSLGSVMQNLAQNLQSNMEAVKTLGDTLDNMIRSNIMISSHLKPIKDAVQLTVRIENKTNFPLVQVNGDFIFDSAEQITIEHKDSYFIVMDVDNNQEVEEVVPSLFEDHPTHLPPHSIYEQVSAITTLKPTYCVADICLSFPHPTRNGQTIYIEEHFGLYLIDQLIKSTTSVQKEHDPSTNTIQRTYSVKFIRGMMDIHPIKGMDKGMCINLSGKEFEAICKVIDFSGDYATCQVEFLLINGVPDILDRVIYELDSLAKME